MEGQSMGTRFFEAECLLFLLLAREKRANLREIGLYTTASRRTVSRYMKDLHDCLAIPELRYNRASGEYVAEEDEWNLWDKPRGTWPDDLCSCRWEYSRLSAGTSRREIHLRRLARVTRLLYRYGFEQGQLETLELEGYLPVDIPLFFGMDTAREWYEDTFAPGGEIVFTARTIQRDVAEARKVFKLWEERDV